VLKSISRTVQTGFTLIELMIVIAIIGILAALAIPAYQDYLVRTQASEGLAMASAAKTAVAEFRANRGTWPTGNSEAGIGSAADIQGKYVDNIEVDFRWHNGHLRQRGQRKNCYAGRHADSWRQRQRRRHLAAVRQCRSSVGVGRCNERHGYRWNHDRQQVPSGALPRRR
jgi:prepilin-type N-terminal cleavage/methylation domain-containing protein